MSNRNARLRSRGMLSWRPLAGIALAGIATLAAIPLAGIATLAAIPLMGQEKAQKDTRKDQEFSVTVQGPETEAGLVVSARATAKEVGLPIYPGSIPHKDQDKDNDSPATKLGLWGASFGFRLVVLKMESKDAPRKVADYYQKALARYGTVLDCTNASRPQQAKDENSEKLTCGDDKPETGGMLFKAGTKEKQHIVGVQPNGTGAMFQLLYVEARGEKKNPA
jgi:hypothetical protein